MMLCVIPIVLTHKVIKKFANAVLRIIVYQLQIK